MKWSASYRSSPRKLSVALCLAAVGFAAPLAGGLTIGSPPAMAATVPAAAATGGAALVWGTNDSGQLGTGSDSLPSLVPVTLPVPAGTTITSVRAGCDHGVALTGAGRVLAWGNDFVGALGDGHSGDVNRKAAAVRLPKGTKVKSIASGCQFSLALTTAGQVLAWGTNAQDELGDGVSGGLRSAPVRVRLPGGVKIRAISAGGFFGLALSTTGRVYGWGDDGSGQLGNGTVGPSFRIPVRVHLPGGTKVTALAGGGSSSFALTARGAVLAWGENILGELGRGNETRTISTPGRTLLPKGTRVRSMAAGGDHALALTTTGKLFAWGANGSGQLGNGRVNSAADRPVRVRLPAAVKVTAIAAGLNHSLALTSTGRILAWGDNSVGELGTGSSAAASDTPHQVTLPAGRAALAIGAGPEAFSSLATVRKT
jgi:alpha-tubulin suppressor-like RCC1 family protein